MMFSRRKNKVSVVMLLSSCLVEVSLGQVVEIPDAPAASSVRYSAVSHFTISKSEMDKRISDKDSQYAQLVRDGKVTQAKANEVISYLKALPLESSKEYEVQFDILQNSVMVSLESTSGEMPYSRLFSCKEFSWQLDISSLILRGGGIPYPVADGLAPILPVQFNFAKEFVDILPVDSEIRTAGMVPISTATPEYHQAKLKFANGRLVEAVVGSLETWRYSDYKEGDPFPNRIEYSSEGKVIFTRIDPKVAPGSLDQLLPTPSLFAIDYRELTPKRFTYKRGAGDILAQAGAAIPMQSHVEMPKTQLPDLSRILGVGFGLITIILISLRLLLRKK